MKVVLDTTYLARGHTGTGTYLRELVPALRALGVDVVEASNPRRGAPGSGSLRNALEDARWASLALRRERADLVHHPLPAHTPGARNVVTVHDLAFDTHPELFDRRFATWARFAHARAARRADAVVAVSHTTANEAMTRWGLPRERVVVAHPGPGQALRVPERTEPRHVLYVGDDEPRKNLGLLREAAKLFTTLPVRIAGRAGETVDAAALAELYAGAMALVHPSLDEGFGLVPLEAMTAGVPVVAVGTAAVHEVCGDAAVYVDPHDPAELAAALDRLYAEPELRADLVARGRARAAQFDWSDSARAHVEAYQRAMARD